VIPRKYFSGGAELIDIDSAMSIKPVPAGVKDTGNNIEVDAVIQDLNVQDRAMSAKEVTWEDKEKQEYYFITHPSRKFKTALGQMKEIIDLGEQYDVRRDIKDRVNKMEDSVYKAYLERVAIFPGNFYGKISDQAMSGIFKEKDATIAGGVLNPADRAMAVWNQDNIARVFDPDMVKYLPMSIELSNVKNNGPKVVLKIKGYLSSYSIEVSIKGGYTGFLAMYAHPSEYQISNFSPIHKLGDDINERFTESGISSTILNWFAWTAKENGVRMISNFGTTTFSLLRLYKRFFADEMSRYGGPWIKATNIIIANEDPNSKKSTFAIGQGSSRQKVATITVKAVQGREDIYRIVDEQWNIRDKFALGPLIRIDEKGGISSENGGEKIANVLFVDVIKVRGEPRPSQTPVITILDNAQLSQQGDAAMAGQLTSTQNKTGGIDFNPYKMNLQLKAGSPTETFGDDNQGIKFHIDSAMLEQLQNAPGFVPVIINIRPMANLKEFLNSPNPL
jgi:hypothetical protein